MQEDASVTYFPVGNGDTTLMKVPDSNSDKMLRLLLDCNLRQGNTDTGGNDIFDVVAYLQEILPRDAAGHAHLDVFILTHADEDHCRGFDRTFYQGSPEDFSDDDAKADKIIVDELWFAPRIFWAYDGNLCSDAQSFKDEAQRRIDMHKAKNANRTEAGNRLRVIGYTDNPDLKGLEDVLTVPGNDLNIVDNKEQEHFRFSVLAPVRKDTDDEFSTRNDTSIVLLGKFDVDGEVAAVRALFGGDSGAPIWARIAELNGKDKLDWDLLLAPHHCSWHFFSERSHKDDPTPAEASLDVLDRARSGAWVVASSKPLEDDGEGPPSYEAAEIYLDTVGLDKFICTGETPSRKTPLPIVFLMTANGPVRGESPVARNRTSGVFVRAASTPRSYG